MEVPDHSKMEKNSVIPLYKISLVSFVAGLDLKINNLNKVDHLRLLPPTVLSDILREMADKSELQDTVQAELRNVDLFSKLIKCQSNRGTMMQTFKLLMENNKALAPELQKNFVERVGFMLADKTRESNIDRMDDDSISHSLDQYFSPNKNYREEIDKGLKLGTFLYESGWLEDSLKVLNVTKSLIISLNEDYVKLLLLISCLQKCLHVQALFCCYEEASKTTTYSLKTLYWVQKNYPERTDEYTQMGVPNCFAANLYQELSALHFARSEYDLSYNWSIKSLEHLQSSTPAKICVDVLRQAAKSCVVKRKFQTANLLINSAVHLALINFGRSHSIYADALLDKGFFLLNVDSINKSVEVYMEALKIKSSIFGEKNLNVAVIYEDLAYALYVRQYSSGHFKMALFYVAKAIEIMSELAPENQIMLASAKRVKALILEEIALDNITAPNARDYKGLLKESEELHRSALQFSLDAFGENNVQTAKHYGNLGRLYQSMKRYVDAEEMHQKAIKIKRELLGDCDYEVGLSIGHLASLYNYHMKKYQEAEELYVKSINISLRLFGPTYSGLEYDYRGLLHVYEELNDNENYMKYCDILDEWRILRSDEKRKPTYVELDEESTIETVKEKFFKMCNGFA